MSYEDYSLIDEITPNGFKRTQIPHIKEGDNFVFEGTEGVLKAKKDAYLEDRIWTIEAEDADFNTRFVRYLKGDLAYAPKIFVEDTP